MLTITKNQEWQDLHEHFTHIVDGIGKHIDAGSMDVVIALNAIGLHTIASCEGHLDHGLAYPWVDVRSPDAGKVGQEIARLLHEGKRDETKQLQSEHRLLLLVEEQKLVVHLDAFYQEHQMIYDRHLSIWRYSNGTPRLQSHGAEYQEFRSPDERAMKLAEYQAEMHSFATFLKRQFFGEQVIPPPTETSLYTTDEAAIKLHIEPNTVTHYIMRDMIAAQKKGRDYLIEGSEIERFQRERRGRGKPSRKK